MPTDKWWREADQLFRQLKEILQPRFDENFKEIPDQRDCKEPLEGDQLEQSGKSLLPLIAVLPSSNYVPGLTATNEPLECVAFGTVAPKIFLNFFWESVAVARRNSAIVVHEVKKGEDSPGTGAGLRIVFHVMSHLVELSYFRLDFLGRSLPDSHDLHPSSPYCPGGILERDVQKQMLKLQGHRKYRFQFRGSLVHRTAYYYLRAWAMTMGFLNAGITWRGIALQCTHAWMNGISDFSSVIEFAINNLIGEPPGFLHDTPDFYSIYLKVLEKKPFYQKMRCPVYVQLRILCPGISNGARYISNVSSKLRRLKKLLKSRIPFSAVRVWPERLVSLNSQNRQDKYEASFVLGLDIADSDVGSVNEVAESWRSLVLEDFVVLNKGCSLKISVFQGITEIAAQALVPCKRQLPLAVLDAPGETDISRHREISSAMEVETIYY